MACLRDTITKRGGPHLAQLWPTGASVGSVGRFGVRITTRAECAAGGRWASSAGAEYSPGAQFGQVRQADAREVVQQIGLGCADGRGPFGAGAEGAAGGHVIIVRAPCPAVHNSLSLAVQPSQGRVL